MKTLISILIIIFLGLVAPLDKNDRPYYKYIDTERRVAETHYFQAPEGVVSYAILDVRGLDSVKVNMVGVCETNKNNLKRIKVNAAINK